MVGFDDIFLAAQAYPPLTTVRVPAYGLGWTAAEILIALIEGDEEVSSVIVGDRAGDSRVLRGADRQPIQDTL